MKYFKMIASLCACLMVVFAFSLFVGCKKDDNQIEVNEVTRSIFYAPFYAAINAGYFEEEGLTLHVTNGQGSDTSMAALLSGDADIILAGPETVVYAKKTKDKPKIFGQLTQRDGSFIVGKTDESNFTLASLKGKTIIGGRSGGMPAMTLQYIIETSPLNLKIGKNKAAGEIDLNTDVAFADTASVFNTTSAEYCTLFEPTASALVKENKGYIVSNVGAHSGDVPYTCFIAKSSYLKKKSDKAEKFLKAVVKGYQFVMTQEPSKVAEVISPSFVGTDLSDLETAITQYKSINAWCSNPVMTQSSYNKLIEIINHCNPVAAPTFEEAVDNTIANKFA